jgi:hypothetical protein
MKIKLLFAAMLLCLVSCSDDDNSTTVPVTEVQKNILSIANETYDQEGVVKAKYTIDCENNRPILRKYFDASGNFYSSTEYAYAPNGLLSSYSDYYGAVKEADAMLSYDSDGRLTEIIYTNYNSLNGWQMSSFIYNDDNTITEKFRNEINSDVFITTYFLNASGQIYKIQNSNGAIGLVTYEGNNVTSLTTYAGTLNYIYDNVTEVKGDFLNLYENQVGSNTNAILWLGFSTVLEGVDRYKTNVQSSLEMFNTEYTYEFDEDGYPVEKTMHIAAGSSVMTIVYE